jgi:Leucine-rich repeat (LRR) protein
LQTENIKSILQSLESEETNKVPVISELPEQAVNKAPEAAVLQLQKRGIAVAAIAQNSNYLSVNFVAAESFSAKDLQLLEPLKKQIIWLKLGYTPITDADMETISKLSGLIRLSLEKTNITDEGIKQLKDLTHLQYLNLVGTKVTTAGLRQLTTLKNLQHLYLYQTSISNSDWISLVQLFPETLIDTGGYVLEKLIEDTIVLKVPQVK